MMVLDYVRYDLRFRHPFGVSSNTRTETPVVFVRLKQGDFYGYGEACLPPYLGEQVGGCEAYLQEHKAQLSHTTLDSLSQVRDLFNSHETVNYPGQAALEMALLDLLGKMTNKPVWELLGLQSPEARDTSFTIAIGDESILEKKILEARDFKILKIKAGTSDDKKLVQIIRRYTDKPLFIDVNQGWSDRRHVFDMLQWLKEKNVLLVEQPMPREMKEEMKGISSKNVLPTIADESVKNFDDLLRMDGSYSGINVKLMKCGGLLEALKMIRSCKQNSIRVMLGCMAESTCATAAMAQLTAYADFVDLDAPLLYTNDPFEGLSYRKGKILPPAGPGLGIRLLHKDLFA